MIEVIPLNVHVGAEIRGVDFCREIDPTMKDELYAAWLKHLVLVIRSQNLTADDQRRFTTLFGEIQPPRSRPGQRDPNNPVMWIANATIDGQRGESLISSTLALHLLALVLAHRLGVFVPLALVLQSRLELFVALLELAVALVGCGDPLVSLRNRGI